MINVQVKDMNKMRPASYYTKYLMRANDVSWHNVWRIERRVFILRLLELLWDMGYEVVKCEQTSYVRVKSLKDKRKRFQIFVAALTTSYSKKDFAIGINDSKDISLISERFTKNPNAVNMRAMIKEAENAL